MATENARFLWLIWVISACGEPKSGGGSAAPAGVDSGSAVSGPDSGGEDTGSAPESDTADLSDLGAAEVPSTRYAGAAVQSALDAGDLTEGQAALALWQIYFGFVDRVDPSLLVESTGETDVPVHVFLASVLERLDELPEDEAAAIEALHAEVYGDFYARKDELPSSPVGDFQWCKYAVTSDNCVKIWAPLRLPCERDESGSLVLDEAGQWTPAGCHPHIFGTEHPAIQCSSMSVGVIRGNAAMVMPTVVDAAERSYPTFMTNLSTSCNANSVDLMVFDTSPADWGSAYGVASPLTGSRCRISITATPPGQSESSWLSDDEQVRGTVAHELFHCAQYEANRSPSEATWFIEGTATWAEDVIGDAHWSGLNTEHGFLHGFYSPSAYLDRGYSAATAMLMMSDVAPSMGYDLVKSTGDLVNALVGTGGFNTQWHEASVSTWNQAPVDIWTNDGASIVGSSRPDEDTELPEDEMTTAEITGIPAVSYDVSSFSVGADVEVIQVELTVPGDVMASAILQGGDNERVESIVSEEEMLICPRAIGMCHDRKDDELDEIDVLGVVATNLSKDEPRNVEGSIDTHAPALHGRWRTTAMWSSANPAMIVQSGGTISIDEEADPDTFSEELTGVGVYADLGYCESEGTSTGQVTSDYADAELDVATGVLSTLTLGGGAGFLCEDPDLPDMSGATPGMWIMAATGSPWAPVDFTIDEDSLTLVSAEASGMQWFMTLTRIADEP